MVSSCPGLINLAVMLDVLAVAGAIILVVVVIKTIGKFLHAVGLPKEREGDESSP